jgi:hypothetical protein
VGVNSDKTGYSLSQSFPANFADLAITATTGRVTVGTVADKAGYKLASDGLDSISTAAPTGLASNFREMQVQTWRRFFEKHAIATTGSGTADLKTYADDGSTVVTTQACTDDGTTQTTGAAS